MGKEAPEVVEATVDRMLESTRSFSIPLKRGGSAAEQGDLLEHDEVVERIERKFRS